MKPQCPEWVHNAVFYEIYPQTFSVLRKFWREVALGFRLVTQYESG